MEPKSKFRNTSGGVAGAVTLDANNQARGVPVYPDESIWLTEMEQMLTANAPRNEVDNPFTDGTFTLEVRSEDATHARPIGDLQDVEAANRQAEIDAQVRANLAAEDEIEIREETGAAAPPEGPAPEGQRAEHEEVAVDIPEELAPDEPAPEPAAVEESVPPPLPPAPSE